MIAVALTIAGSDPSGGAGIQADLKTFHQFGTYGEAVITLLTVQNTRSVSRVEYLPADLVFEQIRAVAEDIAPGACKTGALGNSAIVEAVARASGMLGCPLVIDPVMVSKHGARLMDEDASGAVRRLLLPVAYLMTPNMYEAAVLTGQPVSSVEQMRVAARQIQAAGARNVLIKGGHLDGPAVDVLLADGEYHELVAERIPTQHTHGTGCTYSAAITAELAKGTPLIQAVRTAKDFVTEAIRTNPGLGGGSGPLNHHA